MLNFKVEDQTVAVEAPRRLTVKLMREISAWMNAHRIAAHVFKRPEFRREGMRPEPSAWVLSYSCNHFGFASIDEEGWEGDEGHRWIAADLRDCLLSASYEVAIHSFYRMASYRRPSFRVEVSCDGVVLATCAADDEALAVAGIILWARAAEKANERKVVDTSDLPNKPLAAQVHLAFLRKAGATQ